MKAFVTASLLLPTSLIFASCSSSQDSTTSSDPSDDPTVSVAVGAEGTGVHVNPITEAPTGFDNLTNGFSPQAAMDPPKAVFADEVEETADALGPTYNAQSCRECHQSPVIGAGSQTTEFRNGHFDGTNFVDPPGGSLQND